MWSRLVKNELNYEGKNEAVNFIHCLFVCLFVCFLMPRLDIQTFRVREFQSSVCEPHYTEFIVFSTCDTTCI